MFRNFLIISFALFMSCQSSQRIGNPLAEDFECSWNDSKTMQLCITKAKGKQFPNPTRFEIFTKAGKLLYSGDLVSGYVKWLSNSEIEYYSGPENIPEGRRKDDLVKIYQIKTGKVLSKVEYDELQAKKESKKRKLKKKK